MNRSYHNILEKCKYTQKFNYIILFQHFLDGKPTDQNQNPISAITKDNPHKRKAPTERLPLATSKRKCVATTSGPPESAIDTSGNTTENTTDLVVDALFYQSNKM